MLLPRALALAMGVGALCVLGACGDDSDQTATTTTEATSTTEDPDAAIEAEVLSAYAEHWATFIEAGDPPDPEAASLAENHTGRVLEGTRDVLRRYVSEGVGIRGEYQTDASVRLLREASATIEDCGLDQTEVFLIASGEVVEDSDDERDGLVVTLLLEDGLWKVSEYERDEGVCEQ